MHMQLLQGQDAVALAPEALMRSDTPSQRSKKPPVFTYRCTNCMTKNKTNNPPEDCMLHCSRCGFLTVQACDSVEARL